MQVPLCYLAKSLENMSLCNTAYFVKGWEDARGCRIEHEAAESCGGDNQRRKNGWKDCQFPSFQVGPPRISINPWQFEGFLTPAGEHGRITTRRGA